MKVCADVAPVVRYGVASLLILLWVQYALSMLVISWVQKLVARRATVMSSSITTPHYGTDSTGRPVRPKYVKVVSFVPSLAEWRGTPLPYPPREIQPEAEDGAQGNGLAGGDEPECSICYGEFLPPYRAIMAGKPGTWCADPLWELQCGHIFHEHCCAEWFAVRGAQPMCPYCTQPANNIQPQPTSRPPADPVGL
jgi:hypothetical protein